MHMLETPVWWPQALPWSLGRLRRRSPGQPLLRFASAFSSKAQKQAADVVAGLPAREELVMLVRGHHSYYKYCIFNVYTITLLYVSGICHMRSVPCMVHAIYGFLFHVVDNPLALLSHYIMSFIQDGETQYAMPPLPAVEESPMYKAPPPVTGTTGTRSGTTSTRFATRHDDRAQPGARLRSRSRVRKSSGSDQRSSGSGHREQPGSGHREQPAESLMDIARENLPYGVDGLRDEIIDVLGWLENLDARVSQLEDAYEQRR